MFSSCQSSQEVKTLSGLNPKDFETVVDGDSTALYVLTNKNGMEVCVTNFGARIVSVMVPDAKGQLQDVVLGFDSIGQYIRIPSDFGAAIGRYANRINKGQISVGGETIQLPVNNYGHCLHGGPQGWQYKVFKATPIGTSGLKLTLVSPDGDMNFPGNVTVSVTYRLTDDNAIDIQYEGTTDKETILNMTNHSYFNLNGDASTPITDDTLFINADAFTPVDSTFMTTGEITSVAETPFDFTTPTPIGARIDMEDNEQLANGHGYDHNWVLRESNDITTVAAKVVSPVTGIVLEVLTDQPGIQIYTGNFLDGTVTGKKGVVYNRRAAICLETQVYPDSPNKSLVNPSWPSPYLKPGETYTHHTIFRFSVNK
ncbi:MAG: aldose epimerase family protein [Bacteroidaceae bacterium]|nr:aldose epimerase family protein [Bacteroidaceae bacterium]